MANAFCEVASVREVLRMKEGYVDSDLELERCISSADRLLRSWAKAVGLTIPDSVPEDIDEASKHLAAWIFKSHGDPPINDQVLFDLGKGFFDSWVAGNADATVDYVGSV